MSAVREYLLACEKIREINEKLLLCSDEEKQELTELLYQYECLYEDAKFGRKEECNE